MKLGILAFGSLITFPGPEIASVTVGRIEDVLTPFNVEFARKSKTRGYAPTLIPVDTGGARIRAQILVLRNSVTPEAVQDMLWRRETRQTGRQKYRRPEVVSRDDVLVETILGLSGVETLFYTRIGQNIEQLTAKTLAELAIQSVRSAPRGSDGITYLMDAMKSGIETPLSRDYASEIIRQTGAKTLAHGLNQLRAGKA